VLTAIVRGENFLGFQGAGGCRALVIDLEQGIRTVKRRLREAGLDDSDAVDYVRVPDGLSLGDKPEAEAVKALLGRGYDVVLLDPWYKAHLGDSNAERETTDLMRLLDRWRDEHGFGLVLPMHTRKPPPADAGPRKLTIHDLFGSSAAVRGAEVVLGLQLLHPGYSQLYFFKCRDGDDELPINGEPWGLLFDRDDGFRRQPEQQARQEELVERARAFLLEHPRSTKNAIRKALEVGKERLNDVLREEHGFTFEPGANNAQLWVVSDAETHSDHLFPAEAVEVVAAGGHPPVGGVPSETTDHRGGSALPGPLIGDDGFDDLLLGAFEAGHITDAEALERHEWHKALAHRTEPA
jgi:hypothetical protein